MVMCFVLDCNHYSEQKVCKYFVFPANPAEKKRWITLINRQDREPSKYSLVCSCHFVNMDRKNGPTIFHNAKRKFEFVSAEKRKRSHLTTDVEMMKPSECTDTETPSMSRIESLTSSMENLPSCSGSTSRVSGASLEAENCFLKFELEDVTEKVKNLTTRFSYEHIKNNDSHVLMYTGIPTSALFLTLYETMDSFKINYYAGWQVKLLPKIDQLLMTLMKLRLNLPHEDLGIRFNCSPSTVTNVVMTWIYALHEVLFKQLMEKIPSRLKNQACLSSAFSNFKNCRIILDCTEIYSAIPSNMETQRLTYSSYKHKSTWKVLVGTAPNGVITFVSKAYPGSTSDKKIVEHSEVLKQMVPGDFILAGKGFLFKDLLPAGVSINISPFLSTPQFTQSQVYDTERIAKAKIHVERAIRRTKCFRILQEVPQYYMSQISIIFQLCAALTSFQYPLIKEIE